MPKTTNIANPVDGISDCIANAIEMASRIEGAHADDLRSLLRIAAAEASRIAKPAKAAQKAAQKAAPTKATKVRKSEAKVEGKPAKRAAKAAKKASALNGASIPATV